MKIRRIDTVILGAEFHMRPLLVVRVWADELVGHSDTFYVPEAVAAYIHDYASEQLLGTDARDINSHWDRAYRSCARFGAGGAEMRGISAIDIALWDILGKALNAPVYRLLGGMVRERIPVYNTCAGLTYSDTVRPGLGRRDAEGLDGVDAVRSRSGEVAVSLVEAGYAGMKVWPFDEYALARGGSRISTTDLKAGVGVFESVRNAVGFDFDLMLEGHGYWELAPAREILRAVEPYHLRWAEDLLLASSPATIAGLRASTSVPLAVSEYLFTRWGYKPFLDRQACDYAMVDPSWCGGITESRRICSLASAYGLPATMHDATGPFTFLAGIHLAASTENVLYQEAVRPFVRELYPLIADLDVSIEGGTVSVPTRAGLGASFVEEALGRPGTVVRTSKIA